MKFVKAVLGISTLALFAFGCQKEIVRPQDTAVEIQGSIEGIQRPANPCGTSAFTNFVDATNTVIGSVEVLNTDNEMFLLMDMTGSWLLKGVKVFVGNSINLPKTGSGMIEIEEFPFQYIHNRAQDKTTIRVDISSLALCNGISIYGQAVKLNQFGNVVQSRNIWADGTNVLNGKMFNYCSVVCTPFNQGPAQVF